MRPLSRTLALAAWCAPSPKAALPQRIHEAGVRIYPVLAAGGLKLILEDVPAGRPATLVASLVLFGGALILAPALTRRRAAQPPASS